MQNYPRWDANRARQAIGASFDRSINNNNDYMSAISEAAGQNKPVVMLIGKSSDPATRAVVENALRESRLRTGKDAYFAFVDMDSVDKSSAIGKYAHDSLTAKGQEPPFLMVFALNKSAQGGVRAEAPSFYKMGNPEPATLSDAVSRARQQMSGRFDNNTKPSPELRPDQKPTPKPEITPRPETNPEKPNTPPAENQLREQIALALMQAHQEKDRKAAYESFKKAIDLSDLSKNPMLQAASRVELGLACLNWGFSEQGFKWLLDAGSKCPDLYNESKNQPFRQRLEEFGLPKASRDMLFEKGKSDANWYQKDPNAVKSLEASLRASQPKPLEPKPEAKPEPKPQPRPLPQEKPVTPTKPTPRSGNDRPSPWD